MKSQRLRSSALLLGTMAAAFGAGHFLVPGPEDGGDPCFQAGKARPGILEASLKGTMTSDIRGQRLVIDIPESFEPNQWSKTHADGPNTLTDKRVFSAKDNEIRVPAGEVALIWFEIAPPKDDPGRGTRASEIRFVSDLTSVFQSAPGSKLEDGSQGSVVMFCDDNSGNPEEHSWEFGVKIDGEWYDPQIKNLGATPPPPPLLPSS